MGTGVKINEPQFRTIQMNQMAELSAALNRCISPTFASLAKAVQAHSLKLGVLSSLHFATRLLSAFPKCRMFDEACQLFDEIKIIISSVDIVFWNAIISACVQNGRDEIAFQYFKHLQFYSSDNDDGLAADSYTLSSLLSSKLCLEKASTIGEQLHGYATKTGILSNVSVGNALITFYAAWDRLPDSKMVFESMQGWNVVSWTALISGYAQQMGHEEEALKLFILMMSSEDELKPNQYTFASVFRACGSFAQLSQGTALIPMALKTGFLCSIHVQNSLLAFYAECGCLDDAEVIFSAIIEPDIVSWNSLLKGYSQQGRGKEALKLFDEMIETGVLPDSITFVSILSACSHSGLISQGLELFHRMELVYGIESRSEHISCIVSLLGRAGWLHQAVEFIQEAKIEAEPSVWRTLLGACRLHSDARELADWVAAQLLLVDPFDTEAHVVLSNINASVGRWDIVRNLRCSMREKRVGKEPGSSWIEVGNKVHIFMSSDCGHPQMEEIGTRTMELANNIKDQA